MITEVVFTDFVKGLLSCILPWAWNNFLCSLRENLRTYSGPNCPFGAFVVSELIISARSSIVFVWKSDVTHWGYFLNDEKCFTYREFLGVKPLLWALFMSTKEAIW